MRRRRGDDRGTFALELAIVAPVIFGLLWLIVSAGRMTVTASKVEIAARDGARAASINHNNASGAQVRAAVFAAVQASLKRDGVSCVDGPQLGPFPARPAPGDPVTISVTCRVALLGPARTAQVTRSVTSVLDTYRGTT